MFDYRAQGYECCKTCDNQNKLRCVFCEEYDKADSIRLYNMLKDKRGCSTCANCKRVYQYPDYVTGEECICEAIEWLEKIQQEYVFATGEESNSKYVALNMAIQVLKWCNEIKGWFKEG